MRLNKNDLCTSLKYLLSRSVEYHIIHSLTTVPRTGGTTISTLLSTCHTLVQASSSFTSPLLYNRESDDVAFASRFRDPTLYVVRTHHQQFVNVDLDSYEGVQRALNGKLIESELANVVVVPDVRLGSLLFGNGNNDDDSDGNTNGGEGEEQQQLQQQEDNGDSDGDNKKQQKKEYKGVLFAMFRHPIDRAVSEFYNKQNVKDSVHYDQVSLVLFHLFLCEFIIWSCIYCRF